MRLRLGAATGAVLVIALVVTAVFSGPAQAAGTVNVNPSTNLNGGQVVTVSGSGMVVSSFGSVEECNDVATQPTVTFLGNAIPVGCTAIKGVSTDASGNVPSTAFTIVVGTVGPPTTGTDSAGHPAGTDAADYPCPPTPAQVTAGASCVIAFGDLGGDKVTVPIAFSPNALEPTTTVPTSTTTTAPPATTTTVFGEGLGAPRTTIPGAATSPGAGAGSGSGSSGGSTATTVATGTAPSKALAFTGPRPELWLLAIAGLLLLDLGYLALTVLGTPRQLLRRVLADRPPGPDRSAP